MIPGMEQALAVFINESKELLEEMESCLLSIEESGSGFDSEIVNSIFRAIHTIKGSAGIFGFDEIVKLTHITETVLEQVRNGDIQLDNELISLLYHSHDLAEELVLLAAQEKKPEQAISDRIEHVTQQFMAYQTEVAAEPVSSDASNLEPRQGSSKTSLWHITFKPKKNVFRDGLDPLSFIRYLTKIGTIELLETDERALVFENEFDPELCYLSFEISFLTSSCKEEILDVFDFIHTDADITLIPPELVVSEYISRIQQSPSDSSMLEEVLVKTGTLTKEERDEALETELDSIMGPIEATNWSIQQHKTLRIEAQKLDRLIDQVGEMVINGARTSLLAHETGNEQLIEAMGHLERLVENVRDSSLKLRMVQIGGIFSKFKRVVRDVAEDMGKKVRLEIRGSDTELDKTFVEKISDPLTHIIRNSIDHGIELPEVRINKGKHEVGNIVLSAYHESGSIVIEIRDDGKGIDINKVREIAIDKGLIAETAHVNNKELFSLIFEPGFSTSELVTNISGRGVGMDVVKRNVDALRGTVEIDSEVDKGARILIRLPLTLSIIDGFMFEVFDANYVIPLDTIVECMELHELVDAERLRDKNCLSLRGEVLPFVRLRSLFGIDERASHESESLLIVQFGNLRAGLVVDALRGEFQTVVKPLGRLFEGARCISGATILGSGAVAIILDVSTLIESAISGHEKAEADKYL
ncbi:chemotaxis protein CheA [Vibrio sp. HN007]|uniref:chemotaxis protein CheA n=1 Tax=Vibrio iocasae TaxID=3098914 RepID=UPI0035D4FCED